MSENTSRIYLKVGEIEISIEGTPDYVSQQYKQMAKDLNLQQKLQSSSEDTEKPKSKKTLQTTKTKKTAPKREAKKSLTNEDFREWFNSLPKGIKNNDIILVAAYFNQLNAKENTFRVRDINNTLKENGIKITNPSSLINYMVKKKKVIKQVKKVGRQNYFQITKEGEKYIKDLMGIKEK